MLAVPRRLPSRNDADGWSHLEAEVLRRLASDERFIFELTADGRSTLHVSRSLRGSALLAAGEAAGLPLDGLYPLVRRVTYRMTKRAKPASPMYLPRREALEHAFRYIGLLYGDGDGNGFLHGADEALLREALTTLQGLVPRPSIARHPPRVSRVESRSKTLLMFLHVVLGYPLRQKARSMRLPDLLFAAPLPVAAAFVQGYLDADGTVERGRRAVSVTSASERFLDDLQLLLLRFGIRAILDRRESRTTLYISGRTNLARLPRFRDSEKLRRLDEVEGKGGPSYVVDLVPADWDGLEKSSWKTRMYDHLGQTPSPTSLLSMVESDLTRVETVLNEDVAFVEVRSIREVSEQWVYDFSVP